MAGRREQQPCLATLGNARAKQIGRFKNFVGGMQRAGSHQNGYLRAGIEHIGGALQILGSGTTRGAL